MQIPRVGLGPSIARPAVPVTAAPPRRERLVYSAVPAIAATVLGLLIFLVNPGLMIATSALVGLVLAAVLLRERQHESNAIILVGRSPMAAMVAVTLEQQAHGRGYTILRAAHLAEAAALARNHACDEVVLVGPTAPQSIPLVDARGQAPEIVPGAEKLEQLLSRVPLELAEQDRWLNRLHGARPLEAGYALAKRATDIGVALGLSLALLPLFPLVALAIKLDSRGSIFYSQDRVGLNGRLFRIYKFRTMVQDAEKHGAVWATKTDAPGDAGRQVHAQDPDGRVAAALEPDPGRHGAGRTPPGATGVHHAASRGDPGLRSAARRQTRADRLGAGLLPLHQLLPGHTRQGRVRPLLRQALLSPP